LLIINVSHRTTAFIQAPIKINDWLIEQWYIKIYSRPTVAYIYIA